mmetsp:Transcript_14783/g.29436  ORF Transcript_14783/g.29436 Transcript_14783/m.29436 type:complete len:209 (+) Transcript_14783:709-1335(+)
MISPLTSTRMLPVFSLPARAVTPFILRPRSPPSLPLRRQRRKHSLFKSHTTTLPCASPLTTSPYVLRTKIAVMGLSWPTRVSCRWMCRLWMFLLALHTLTVLSLHPVTINPPLLVAETHVTTSRCRLSWIAMVLSSSRWRGVTTETWREMPKVGPPNLTYFIHWGGRSLQPAPTATILFFTMVMSPTHLSLDEASTPIFKTPHSTVRR